MLTLHIFEGELARVCFSAAGVTIAFTPGNALRRRHDSEHVSTGIDSLDLAWAGFKALEC